MVENRIMRILISPADTARSISSQKPDLITPFFIVLITGFLLGVVGMLNSHKPFEAEAFQTLYSLFFMILEWAVLSVSVFLISHLWRKMKSSYLKTMELIAYAYLPIAVGLLLEIISLIFGMSFWPIYSILSGSWSFVIMVVVVKEINQFSTLRSVITIMISFIVVMILSWNFMRL